MSTKLCAVTYLAPNIRPVYAYLIAQIGRALGCETELVTGAAYDEVYGYDLAFICGLPYVHYTAPRMTPSPIEAIAAPVLVGSRYESRPIYFSDVIVHCDSLFQSFADLRGASWAYNEPLSQSGYGITRYTLVGRGETNGYFGKVIEAGFHQKAIRLVARREVDAAAIDSHVLTVELRDHPELAEQIRVIDILGPSTIQPLAAASHLPASLKADIQAVVTALHHDPQALEVLNASFIERYVAVQDSDYDDIRAMLSACEAAGYEELR